jgi:hypothetical protein
MGDAPPAGEAPASPTVDIKFVIVPEGFSHVRTFATALSVAEVKGAVEQDLRIPVANMSMFFGGQGGELPPPIWCPGVAHILPLHRQR